MSDRTGSRTRVLLLAIGLLTAGLAGCVGSTSGEAFATFEDAHEQAHTTVEAEEDTPLRLGLIEPNETSEVPQGETNVTFVLWDEDAGEPVEDAAFTIDAFMPMMGHGTAPETDPVPVRNGVYRGSTNLMMGGDWLVYLNATLANGQEVHFTVDLDVAGGMGDGGHMDHDKGPQTTYDSYEDAKAAEGETFAPEQNASTRLKLLEPEQRENLTQGEQNVTLLLFDEDADEPVTNGTVFLNATMPDMGHGASPEEDPAHAAHGVWKGLTTFSMNGTWVLDVELVQGDETLSWAIDVTVGNASTDDGEGDDEPPFEPYEEVFEDDVSSADYDVNHTLPVEAANATLTMNGTLSSGSPLDELTVELYDTEDNQLGSFTLTSDTNESSLQVQDAPTAGDYSVRVAGMAVDASYRVAVTVAP